jgi:hypothetical protein
MFAAGGKASLIESLFPFSFFKKESSMLKKWNSAVSVALVMSAASVPAFAEDWVFAEAAHESLLASENLTFTDIGEAVASCGVTGCTVEVSAYYSEYRFDSLSELERKGILPVSKRVSVEVVRAEKVESIHAPGLEAAAHISCRIDSNGRPLTEKSVARGTLKCFEKLEIFF